MDGGGRPKLPLLKEGSRNLITGTYLAEQISSVAYDLVSSGASPSRTHVGRAGAMSPCPQGSSSASPRDALIKSGRKKKENRRTGVKCTQLQALENIDTLFMDGEAQVTDGKGEESLESPRLGKISELPEDHDDMEFREWLTLPSIGESPRANVSTWHLLLSHKTFQSHSDQHVAGCLVQILAFTPQAAHHKALELRKRRLVVLEAVKDKGEAFRKLQKLRSLGLQAQVAMDFGLPGDGQFSQPRKKQRKEKQSPNMRSYTELFFRAGAERSSGRMASESRVCKKRAGLTQWRSSQCRDFEQDVLPEDPVEALFLAEREKDRVGGASLFKVMLSKHHAELQNNGKEPKDKARGRSDITGNFVSAMKKTEGHLITALQDPDKPMAGPGEAASSPKGDGLLEGSKPKEGAPLARKEACLLMRFFVFGHFGNEDWKDKQMSNDEREAIFHESSGTKEQVKSFFRIWSSLDDDLSGRVDLAEFRTFAEQNIHEMVNQRAQPGEVRRRTVAEVSAARKSYHMAVSRAERKAMHHHNVITLQLQSVSDLFAQATEDRSKFCIALVEKLSAALLGKKSSFTIEDMMRLVWLSTNATEAKVMKNWCREFYEDTMRDRVDTPPVLDTVEWQGLCSVFEHFDEEKEGEITFDTLVTKGLIYSDQVEEYRLLWDDDGNGRLSQSEFCDMMCPVGFRASAKSEIGSGADGRRVLFDYSVGCWKLEALNENPAEQVKEVAEDLLS